MQLQLLNTLLQNKLQEIGKNASCYVHTPSSCDSVVIQWYENSRNLISRAFLNHIFRVTQPLGLLPADQCKNLQQFVIHTGLRRNRSMGAN